MEYIIVGDTEKYEECLIYTCGMFLENAKKTLIRLLTNPTERDKRLIAGHTNLRIKEVEDKDCWWKYYTD